MGALQFVTKHTFRYPLELREQAIRMAHDIADQYRSESAALTEVAKTLGIGTSESVRRWLRQSEVDSGRRVGVTSEKADISRQRNREDAELSRTQAILKAAAVYFDTRQNRPALVVEFIQTHRDHRERGGLHWGVEPMCSALTAYGFPIAPSTYYEHLARKPSRRHKRDERMKRRIGEVYAAQEGGIGAREMWLHLVNEGLPVARCTVERLMRELGLRGGKGGRRPLPCQW